MASEEATKVNKRLTALAAIQASYSGDVAGRVDLSIQAGDALMELTRLSGSEGRKGTK